MFELKNISKKYGDEFALKDATLTIGKGLNFIIGASGSGKTTLLKIMSGLEQNFEGDVFYCGKSINDLKNDEKSYFYNHIFGFVWQDFNLIEEYSVLENIMLPFYLKNSPSQKAALSILKTLKISQLANQKVKSLSGGQKQRVAIARELMKNPQVIIADEPTSALDAKSSKLIIDILRDIAKTRTVIIVTHDTSLIDDKSTVYQLDKGELILAPKTCQGQYKSISNLLKHYLSFNNAYRLSLVNIKNKIGRFTITTLSILLSAILLLVSVSGAVTDSSKEIFDELYATYGDGLLDISVVGSFMSAAGGTGDKPNANVTQDISGLHEVYSEDERVAYTIFLQPLQDISATVDGTVYQIETSNNVPVLNKITTGAVPSGNSNDIVVPQSFVAQMGLTETQVIGKSITIAGSMYNWDSGEPVAMPIAITGIIVGVADTKAFSEYEGVVREYSIDDSFFFSKNLVDEIRNQANLNNQSVNFLIRAQTPKDMIAIKDELNAQGIVPLGQFELVEDMVRLSEQTSKQSGSATVLISILSVVLALAVTLITAMMRKREYAIYKVSGYNQKQLSLLTCCELSVAVIGSIILFLLTSPLLNLATTSILNTKILNPPLLLTGVILIALIGCVASVVTLIIIFKTNPITSLKTGER